MVGQIQKSAWIVSLYLLVYNKAEMGKDGNISGEDILSKLIDNVVEEKIVEEEPVCPLSQLEEDIMSYDDNMKHLKPLCQLLTLDEVKKEEKQKGEVAGKWKTMQGSQCDDTWDECPELAKRGTCSGQNHMAERIFQTKILPKRFEALKNANFTLRNPDEVSYYQIGEMMTYCRASCKKHFENVPFSELPAALRAAGGVGDIMVDSFGGEVPICDVSQGWNVLSRKKAITSLIFNHLNPEWIPQFSKNGFKKTKIPKDLYVKILTMRKRGFSETKKSERWRNEWCTAGQQNCQKLVENDEQCRVVSSQKYKFHELETWTRKEIFKTVLPILERWVGGKISLVGTACYGLRRYGDGAFLMPHLDHSTTHIISAILNIAQDVDEEWPLQIMDHQQKMHEILLQPGDMVLYESAKLVHGRSKPFKGKYFENMFVHFMPRYAQETWYQEDLDLISFPSKKVTIEDLEKMEEEMKNQDQPPREKAHRV